MEEKLKTVKKWKSTVCTYCLWGTCKNCTRIVNGRGIHEVVTYSVAPAKECEECEGKGETETACPHCNGTGEIREPCDDCLGEGVIPDEDLPPLPDEIVLVKPKKEGENEN